MGTVYLAERDGADFDQQVALKVLRADLLDEDLLRRFRAERRILAALRHPHIAAMLDGGTTDDGRPFVVMERIEGTDLITHSAERGLDVPARIELFCRVCAAVEHAHRNLVVHRDLKPANVLVTANDQPKLLDFGIAKLLTTDESEHSLAVTRAGMMLFTPEYASPEQVRGEAITTSTDVYALGAVLFELLTGVPAHRLDTRAPGELERVICREERTAPSSLAADPRRRRELVGDLDNIVLRALRTEPERRYGSARELAADLRRHLEGRPVTARPDTWRYRTAKFMRRNRLAVGTAAAFVLLVAGSALALLVQAQRIREERDIARTESEVAREVSDFLVRLFDVADATRAEQLKARDLLARGSQRVADELDAPPLVRAGLMHAMGRASLVLGLVPQAAPLLEQAHALRQDAAAPPAALADSMQWLGQLRVQEGSYQQAEELVRAALEHRRSTCPDDGPALATNLRVLSGVIRAAGRPLDAQPFAEQAAQLLGDDAPPIAVLETLRERGLVERDLGRADAALALFEQARDVAGQEFGNDHPAYASTLRLLGEYYDERGRGTEAIRHFEKALAVMQEAAGDDHPSISGITFRIASAARSAGDLERAEALLREVLERDRAALGDHPGVARDLDELAFVLYEKGEYAEAEQLFRAGLAAYRRLLPPEHPDIAIALSNVAMVLHVTGRADEAEAPVREALAIREKIFPPEHSMVLASRQFIAVLHDARGEFPEAERELFEVLQGRRQALGDHSLTAGTLYSLATTTMKQGRIDEALDWARQALEMYRGVHPQGHYEIAIPLYFIGRVLLESGEAAEGEAYLREAHEVRRATLPAEHPEALMAAETLSDCLIELRQFAEAERMLRETLKTSRDTYGDGPGAASVRAKLIRLYQEWGKPEEVERVR